MITRRDAIKTIVGASAIGSMSGCLQIATQDTIEYTGTPAMLEMERDVTNGGNFLATGVGIEVQRTVEQFNIRKEVIANGWGMVYQKPHPDDFDNFLSAIVATFTSPSIQIAGQEMNPITDLTVGEIGNNFTQTVVPLDDFHIQAVGSIGETTVEDATGEKVLGAFQKHLDNNPKDAGEYTVVESWTKERKIPDWDGDTYTAGYDTGADDPWAGIIRFDKHNGDFVIIFSTSSPAYEVEDTDDFIVNVSYSEATVGGGTTIFHPPNTNFTREQLLRHLLRTNLRGIQTLVEKTATIVDQTKKLLQKAADNSQDEETDQVISDTLAVVRRIEELTSGMQNDLNQISFQGTGGATPPPEVKSVNETAMEIQELATQAQERMANIRVDVDGDGTYDRTIKRNFVKIKEIGQTVRNGTAWPGHDTGTS